MTLSQNWIWNKENNVIFSNKNQHKSNTIEGFIETNEKEASVPETKAEETSGIESFPNLHANNSKAMNTIGDKSILSAGRGTITDDGGAKNQIKFQSSNSIWDSGKLTEMIGTPDNKEKTISEKQDISQKQAEIRQDRVNDMVENLQNTDNRKANGVSSIGEYSGGSYHKQSNSMSIFDNSLDFERVPEKTAGEKVAEKARQPKEKDENWKKDCKNVSSRSLFNRMFDNL